MPALPIIKTTAQSWDLQAYLPVMLRSANQECQTFKNSPRSNACCDCSGERISKERRNHQGIEITTTSFYYKGHE